MARILVFVTLTFSFVGCAHAAWYDFWKNKINLHPVGRQDLFGEYKGLEGLEAPLDDGHKYEQYWEEEAMETSEIEFGDWITHIEETSEPIWYTEQTMEPIYEEVWESPEPEWEYVDEWIYESDEPESDDNMEVPGMDFSALDEQPKEDNLPGYDLLGGDNFLDGGLNGTSGLSDSLLGDDDDGDDEDGTLSDLPEDEDQGEETHPVQKLSPSKPEQSADQEKEEPTIEKRGANSPPQVSGTVPSQNTQPPFIDTSATISPSAFETTESTSAPPHVEKAPSSEVKAHSSVPNPSTVLNKPNIPHPASGPATGSPSDAEKPEQTSIPTQIENGPRSKLKVHSGVSKPSAGLNKPSIPHTASDPATKYPSDVDKMEPISASPRTKPAPSSRSEARAAEADNSDLLDGLSASAAPEIAETHVSAPSDEEKGPETSTVGLTVSKVDGPSNDNSALNPSASEPALQSEDILSANPTTQTILGNGVPPGPPSSETISTKAAPPRRSPEMETLSAIAGTPHVLVQKKKMEVVDETVSGKKIRVPIHRDTVVHPAPAYGNIPQEWATELINGQPIRVPVERRGYQPMSKNEMKKLRQKVRRKVDKEIRNLEENGKIITPEKKAQIRRNLTKKIVDKQMNKIRRKLNKRLSKLEEQNVVVTKEEKAQIRKKIIRKMLKQKMKNPDIDSIDLQRPPSALISMMDKRNKMKKLRHKLKNKLGKFKRGVLLPTYTPSPKKKKKLRKLMSKLKKRNPSVIPSSDTLPTGRMPPGIETLSANRHQRRRVMPTTCRCVKVGAPRTCYSYTNVKLSFCKARKCAAEYVCRRNGQKPALTCVRKRKLFRIVRRGNGKCKTVPYDRYVYVPYS